MVDTTELKRRGRAVVIAFHEYHDAWDRVLAEGRVLDQGKRQFVNVEHLRHVLAAAVRDLAELTTDGEG